MIKKLLNLIRKISPGFHSKCRKIIFEKLLRIQNIPVENEIAQNLTLMSTLVVISANDGITNDHVYQNIKERSWKGIFMEPIRESFLQLKSNIGNISNIILENSAIAHHDGFIEMYKDAEGKKRDMKYLDLKWIRLLLYNSI